MKIREITGDDKHEWSRMRTSLWPKTVDGHTREIDEFFSGQSIDVVQVFVVEDRPGRPVGFLELNLRNFAEGSRNSRVPYVEAWYVDPDFRGRGLGRGLMREAELWALRNGFRELASDAEAANQEGIDAHKALGFEETERVVCFLKALGPESEQSPPAYPEGRANAPSGSAEA